MANIQTLSNDVYDMVNRGLFRKMGLSNKLSMSLLHKREIMQLIHMRLAIHTYSGIQFEDIRYNVDIWKIDRIFEEQAVICELNWSSRMQSRAVGFQSSNRFVSPHIREFGKRVKYPVRIRREELSIIKPTID
jgi:hypothetical protein